MVRLAGSDYRKALDALRAAGDVDGPQPFPQPVLQALRELVPCDVVTFHGSSSTGERVLVYTGEPVAEVTPEIRDARRRLEREDPVRQAEGAQKLDDVVSLREFRRRQFYVDVHRPLGIEYMLWLYVEPGSGARLEFDRAESNFSERDRGVLDLLRPHLRQFVRAARRRAPASARSETLTPREREVLSYVAEGRTNDEVAHLLRISSQTVRKHLENAYEKLDVHTRTGAAAAVFGLAGRQGSSSVEAVDREAHPGGARHDPRRGRPGAQPVHPRRFR
jgi:DNA-binding CsgD family transcriptional regulator